MTLEQQEELMCSFFFFSKWKLVQLLTSYSRKSASRGIICFDCNIISESVGNHIHHYSWHSPFLGNEGRDIHFFILQVFPEVKKKIKLIKKNLPKLCSTTIFFFSALKLLLLCVCCHSNLFRRRRARKQTSIQGETHACEGNGRPTSGSTCSTPPSVSSQ